ncbi:MAG: hypothetical protein KGH71_06095 [Candidatus Micrarchaeota archaeon]|nr:hypothetical protein [Candidatus Micrarchaeota archaeon]
MEISKMFAVKSVVAGAVITLITGLYNSTPSGLVGAAWYGLPVTWIRKLVVAPQYNPWAVDWTGLVIDLVVWIVVVGVVLYLANSMMKKGKK